MKSVLHKIFACVMALLLLASTTSWMVEKHFCMGHLVDIAFFTDADSCGMLMDAPSDRPEMDCCDYETIAVDGLDDLKLSFDEFSLVQQQFLTALTYSYIDLFEGPQEQAVPHLGYPPPLLIRDLQLLDQVFLI